MKSKQTFFVRMTLKESRLGNILEKDFKLLDAPKLCEVDTICPCFKAMFVGEGNNWLPMWDDFEHNIYKRCEIVSLK